MAKKRKSPDLANVVRRLNRRFKAARYNASASVKKNKILIFDSRTSKTTRVPNAYQADKLVDSLLGEE